MRSQAEAARPAGFENENIGGLEEHTFLWLWAMGTRICPVQYRLCI